MTKEKSSNLTENIPHADQARLNQLVDYFLFIDPEHWLDGYIFRAVVTLNAIGIRTYWSCEGENPKHKNQVLPRIRMPDIAIAVRDEDSYMDDRLGEYPFKDISVTELIQDLIKDFYEKRPVGEFTVALKSDEIDCYSLVINPPQRTLNEADYKIALDELNAFTCWLEHRFFLVGATIDKAIKANMGDECSGLAEKDLLANRIRPGSLKTVVKEYLQKGLPVTMEGIISRTHKQIRKLLSPA